MAPSTRNASVRLLIAVAIAAGIVALGGHLSAPPRADEARRSPRINAIPVGSGVWGICAPRPACSLF
jgi:hypothetical protein